MPEDLKKDIKHTLKMQAIVLGGFVALLWLLEVLDALVFHGSLDRWGIRPRSLLGLRGIVCAPFLHAGFDHLIANTGPLLILGWLVMLRRVRDFVFVWIIGGIIGGAGVWVIGASNSVHIGASIVVFALLGYLLLRGFFERKFWTIVLSVVVGLAYGGLLFGVLPGKRGISWEGHLFGFIGGVLAARFLSRPRKEPEGPAV